MADRGRDLKISILSDTSKFDLGGPADDLDDLASNAGDATDELKRLAAQGKDAQKELDRLNAEAKDNAFDEMGRDAKDTAQKVDRAFDTIGKSAKHMGDEVDHASRDFGEAGHEIRDEALDTGREMAASFSGGVDDILGAGQELLANAGAAFGPAGIAIGIALASGFGLFQKRQEELKALTDDLVERIIDGAGRLTEEGIQSKLQEMAKDGSIVSLGEQAERAGVSADYFARAMAGDTDAAKKVSAAVDRQRAALDKTIPATGKMTKAQSDQFYALENVRKKLGDVSGGLDHAKTAWGRLESATASGITASVDVRAPTPKELANEHAEMQHAMGKPVTTPVTVVGADRAAQIANAKIQDYMRRHPVKAIIRTPGSKAERDIQ